MKKFLTIILVLIGFEAISQPYLIQSSRWEFTKGQRFDSAFRIYNLPILTGDTVIAFNPYSKKVGLKIIAAASTPTLQQVTTAGNTSSNDVYIGSGSLDVSAAFQVESTTKGILPPVMTTAQKNAISSPANGLVAYDATLQDYYVYKSGIGSGWKHIGINAYTQGDMIAPFSFGAATQAISVDTATMFDYAWSTTGNDDSGPTNKYIGTKGAVDFPIRTNNIERILVSSSGSTTFKGNLLFTDNTYDIGASGATRPRTGYFGTSLFSPLVVGGTSTTSPLTFKTTTGVGTTGADMHFLVGNNGATEALTILNNGRVGVGTANPDYVFDVVSTGSILAVRSTGGTYSSFRFLNNLNSTSRCLEVGYTASTYAGPYWTSGTTGEIGFIGNEGNQPLTFATNATERMVISGGGNVTIGSTTSISRFAIPIAPTASANYGLVSLGSGAFDGSTSGFFSTWAGGVNHAINNKGTGNAGFVDYQLKGVRKFAIDSTGKSYHEYTYTAGGTTGNQTIDKVSGSVNIAAAGTTVTVTNKTVTANSIVQAVIMTADATAQLKSVVVSAGSFTINIVACTAETKIGFIVFN